METQKQLKPIYTHLETYVKAFYEPLSDPGSAEQILQVADKLSAELDNCKNTPEYRLADAFKNMLISIGQHGFEPKSASERFPEELKIILTTKEAFSLRQLSRQFYLVDLNKNFHKKIVGVIEGNADNYSELISAVSDYPKSLSKGELSSGTKNPNGWGALFVFAFISYNYAPLKEYYARRISAQAEFRIGKGNIERRLRLILAKAKRGEATASAFRQLDNDIRQAGLRILAVPFWKGTIPTMHGLADAWNWERDLFNKPDWRELTVISPAEPRVPIKNKEVKYLDNTWFDKDSLCERTAWRQAVESPYDENGIPEKTNRNELCTLYDLIYVYALPEVLYQYKMMLQKIYSLDLAMKTSKEEEKREHRKTQERVREEAKNPGILKRLFG